MKGKNFVWFLVNHHGDRRLALNLKVGIGAQQALVESDPARFFVPPYMGSNGWVGVDLTDDADWERVAGLVRESYCLVAPKRLAAEVAASTASSA